VSSAVPITSVPAITNARHLVLVVSIIGSSIIDDDDDWYAKT